MIASLFRGLLDWFTGLLESLTVVAAILLIGSAVGAIAFWILLRGARKLAGPHAESDPSEDDFLDEDPAGPMASSTQRDEDLPPFDRQV